MTTATAVDRLEQELSRLDHHHDSPVVVTCYVDVDGAHRPRRADCLTAVSVLAQQARRRAETADPANRAAVDGAVRMIERWFEERFERAATRGILLAACKEDGWLRTVELPVRVEDQIITARDAHLLQLEAIMARARTVGLVLVDHEKMRVLEYRLGELREYPALFEPPTPHRERQRGWNVTSSPSGSGDAAAQWTPVGGHVDRRGVELVDRHLARCAAALTEHLDAHPVDHLVVAGPSPERTRLERALDERHRSLVAGELHLPVGAALGAIRDALSPAVAGIEARDEEAEVSELAEALLAGSAVLGLRAVLAALSAGRVDELFVSTAFPIEAGARCTSCSALSPQQSRCESCGGATAPVEDIVEAAVAQAAATGAKRLFVRDDRVATDAEGIAATMRY